MCSVVIAAVSYAARAALPCSHFAQATVQLFNMVTGGVPSALDVKRAIDDMEDLLDSCTWSGRLADHGSRLGLGFSRAAAVRGRLLTLARLGAGCAGRSAVEARRSATPAPQVTPDVGVARSVLRGHSLVRVGSFLVPQLRSLLQLGSLSRKAGVLVQVECQSDSSLEFWL